MCQICGAQVRVVVERLDENRLQVLQQAFPVPASLFPTATQGIHDSVVVEVPDEEDAYALVAALKASLKPKGQDHGLEQGAIDHPAGSSGTEPSRAGTPDGVVLVRSGGDPRPEGGSTGAVVDDRGSVEVGEPPQSVAPSPQSDLFYGDLGVTTDDQLEAEEYDRTAGPANEPQFLMIAGTAGTGKTYLARQRAEQYSDAILCATTGIAAVNIGGVTINSLLGYADSADMRVAYEVGKLGAFLRVLLRSRYYRLIIDEVSMMDGNQLDYLCMAVDDINQWQRDNGKRELGITLVGDFAQLPPVNAPFVFTRPSWGRFNTNIIKLTEPKRQGDEAFIAALQAIRRGDRHSAMAYFGSKIVSGEEQNYDGSTILATNAEVDRYNRLRLMNLNTPTDLYKSTRWVKPDGRMPNEWNKNIPETLELKREALVMILANMRDGLDPVSSRMIYANGDLAHYLEPAGEYTYPRTKDRPERKVAAARVRLVRTGNEVIVPMVLREKGKPTGRVGRRSEVEAWIEYMPLRVAYATTCHKSQGLSLDKVQIMFHSRFWATPGMLYVGLSRARTPEGLRLVGTPQQFEARITTNLAVTDWL